MGAQVTKRRYARKADIVRAVEAARASGLAVRSLECRPDGTIRLFPASGEQREDRSDFEAWEAAGRL